MLIRLLSISDFFKAFPTARSAYGTKAFVMLNSGKAEAVRCFAGYDSADAGRPRLGIVMGYRDKQWLCPFSAPFGEIYYEKAQSLQHVYDFISELRDTLGTEAPIRITLAPAFYDEQMLRVCHGVLANYAKRTYWDYDYYYDLDHISDYASIIDRAAKKNLRRALEAGFQYREASLEDAYAVIKQNRESHGYYLAMTLQQVLDTAQIIPASGLVLSIDGADVAAAVIFQAAEGVSQVIYWGDVPGYAHLRPMNLLPLRVIEYCRAKGHSIVDVGPSSTRGIPNTGLCAFKQSVGCQLALKPTFEF